MINIIIAAPALIICAPTTLRCHDRDGPVLPLPAPMEDREGSSVLSAVFAGHRRPRHGRGRPWGRVAAAAFSVITAAGLTAVAVPAAAPAASQTVVSLAFDNGT